jgi:hypothetical protein
VRARFPKSGIPPTPVLTCNPLMEKATCAGGCHRSASMCWSCRKVVSQYRDEGRQLDENPRLWGDEGRTLKQVAVDCKGQPCHQTAQLQCILTSSLSGCAPAQEP